MRENPGPLDPLAVRRVFERIIDESRRLERLAARRRPRARGTLVRSSRHGHRDGAGRQRGAGPEGHRDAGGGRATTCTAPPASATPSWARWARRASVVDPSALELIPGVREVVKISEPYKLVGRTFKREDTVVDVAGVLVGGPEVVVMAGPLLGGDARAGRERRAGRSQAAGARVLRGGAFKPRTSPYAFQGHGEEALRWMREAADANGLAVVSEVMDVRDARDDAALRGLPPGRRAQHAELRPAEGAGPGAPARAAEARPVRHHRGVAALGRVHPGRRQHAR